MRYLTESEQGFDATRIGIPLVRGCHAVICATSQGLFGLNNCGGADNASWKDRSDVFGVFVHGHANGNATANTPYGNCFVSGNDSRGYCSGYHKPGWLGELASFASAVGFGGPICG